MPQTQLQWTYPLSNREDAKHEKKTSMYLLIPLRKAQENINVKYEEL